MPLNKSYRRRRRRFVKRRRMGGPLTMSRRSRPMTVGKVKRIISAELKYSLVNENDTVVNTANPLIIQLTDIDQGDGNTQRDGNRLTAVNYHGHITMTGEDAGVDATTRARITIFRWNEDAGATPPTEALIMQDVGRLGGPFNINNKGMFKVLYSRYFVLVNSNDNVNFKKTLRFYVKLSGKVLYDGVGGAANPKKFQLYMLVSAVSADAANPTIQLSSVFRFTDS